LLTFIVALGVILTLFAEFASSGIALRRQERPITTTTIAVPGRRHRHCCGSWLLVSDLDWPARRHSW
jgi:hypothetical protein